MGLLRIFVMAVLFVVAAGNVSAADISIRLSIKEKNNTHLLAVDNCGSLPVTVKRVVYSLGGVSYTNTQLNQLAAKTKQILTLPVERKGLYGSYALMVTLFYMHGNKEITLLRGRVFDFGESARVALVGKVDSAPVRNVGTIALTLEDAAQLRHIRLFLPAEIPLTRRLVRGKQVFYTVKNNVPTFNNKYTIYYVYERTITRNGKSIHQAGLLKKRLYTGRRYYASRRYAGIAVFTVLLPLVVLGCAIGGYFMLRKSDKGKLLLSSGIVLFVALITFFLFFFNPWAIFWDENYHISAAEKYIQGVMFMEPHPPLGKQLIALGEWLLAPNDHLDKSSFVGTDYIKNVPKGYAFYGVRFFPTLFSALSGLLFFLILFAISKKYLISILFSCFYLFENAVIVHSRSAMLEGTQLFFVLAALLYFVKLLQRDQFRSVCYLKLGLLVSLATAVKVNSLVLLLLFPILYLRQYGVKELLRLMLFPFAALLLFFIWPIVFVGRRNVSLQWVKKMHLTQFARFILWLWRSLGGEWRNRSKMVPVVGRVLLRASLSVAGLLVPFCLSYYAHFAMGSKVINARYYKASAAYKKVLAKGGTANPFKFPMMLRDNLVYMDDYQKKVPKLDTSKPGENGSHPSGWPIGKKSINYRWVKGGGHARILYLQGNPLLWFSGLIAIFFSLFFLVREGVCLFARWGRFVWLRKIVLMLQKLLFFGKIGLSQQRMKPQLFRLMAVFMALYLGYMFAVLRIERVMYLYHYFIPLIFSFVLAYLNYLHIFNICSPAAKKRLSRGVVVFVVLVVLVFLLFAPLTYYWPITKGAFELRNWFGFWGLKFV